MQVKLWNTARSMTFLPGHSILTHRVYWHACQAEPGSCPSKLDTPCRFKTFQGKHLPWLKHRKAAVLHPAAAHAKRNVKQAFPVGAVLPSTPLYAILRSPYDGLAF
jgi:hypothetical protein